MLNPFHVGPMLGVLVDPADSLESYAERVKLAAVASGPAWLYELDDADVPWANPQPEVVV
jgi:hypothetical protein